MLLGGSDEPAELGARSGSRPEGGKLMSVVTATERVTDNDRFKSLLDPQFFLKTLFFLS